jgi:hypothetical protein
VRPLPLPLPLAPAPLLLVPPLLLLVPPPLLRGVGLSAFVGVYEGVTVSCRTHEGVLRSTLFEAAGKDARTATQQQHSSTSARESGMKSMHLSSAPNFQLR